MEITKDSIIGDILDYDRDTAEYFFEIGMHCLGCPASRGESIAQACAVHGTDADELVAKVNVDGGLIGGASLKAADFSVIVKAASV